MRPMLVGLLLMVMVIGVGVVQADPGNLSGGALITHYNPDYVSYRYPYVECNRYYEVDPLTSCDQQNTSIQATGYLPVAWFVVAAFEEEKEWCGVQFGFSDYDPMIMGFFEAHPCFPVEGLEIPSAGWPGPNEGTAFVVTGGDAWVGNFVPVYLFLSYAYGYYGSGTIQLVPDPSVMVPFGGFSSCEPPYDLFDAALGGMGINEPGTWVCYSGAEDYVCCIGEDCVIVQSEDECTLLGGVFHPEWHDCGPPNPCVIVPTKPSTWGTIKNLYR